MKRPYRDPPDWLRCNAQITLKDGTHAQCGKYWNDDYRRNVCCPTALCTQHGNMLFKGKQVIDFRHGTVLQPTPWRQA